MKVNSISYVPKSFSTKKTNMVTENFNGCNVINNKKVFKSLAFAAMLGMAAVTGCKQPTTPTIPTPIEEPVETPTDTTETEETKETETENTETEDLTETEEETQTTETEETTNETEIQDTEDDDTQSTKTEEETPIVIDKTDDTEDTDEVSETDDIENVEDVENPEDVQTEEPPEITVTKTPQAVLFQDETVKEMFNMLGLRTKTQKPNLIEGAYTPYSGDILQVEYQISPSTKQVYDLIMEESTPDKLVYKTSIVYVTAPENAYSYKSTFMKNENGEIIRKDSLAPGYYYKYSILDDSIKIDTINAGNGMTYFRDTIYYQKGRNSSEIQESSYTGWVKYYTNASVTVAE